MSWRTTVRKPSFLIPLAVLLIVGIIWAVTAIHAAQPETLDQRTHDVAAQIQCPVCNGESVADSPSPVAQELRDVIHEQLAEGKSEQQVIDYMHSQYGDAILESPPKQGFTSIIWLAPVLMFLAGLVILVSVARDWQSNRRLAFVGGKSSEDEDAAENEDMSDEERARYLALLRRDLEQDEGFATATEPKAKATEPKAKSGKHLPASLRKGMEGA